MLIGIRAAREQVAIERIGVAARRLAETAGLADVPDLAAIRTRDVEIRAMFRLEAVAGLLEDLATLIPIVPVVPVFAATPEPTFTISRSTDTTTPEDEEFEEFERFKPQDFVTPEAPKRKVKTTIIGAVSPGDFGSIIAAVEQSVADAKGKG